MLTKQILKFENRSVELPYKLISSGDEYVPEVDPNYVFQKSGYYAYLGLKEGHTYIFGETGLGKTDFVYQLAAYLNQPVRDISTHGDTNVDNFLGYLTAENGTVFFKKGILLDCMEKGYWLLIDEIDYGNPSLLSILNNVLQFGNVYVPEFQEKIYAHPDFRVIGTANTAGSGDDTGFYNGTTPMNRALMDRFNTYVQFEFPNEDLLKTIILNRVGHFSFLPLVISFIYEMRKAVTQKQIYTPFGIRSALKFAKKIKSNELQPWEAACLSFANILDTDSKSVVKAIVQRVFGNKM